MEVEGSVTSSLERCSFDKWYPALRKVSIKSVVLPLSHDFVAHLLADGIFVDNNSEDSDDGDQGEDDWSAAASRPRFPELEQNITDAIEELGGTVFPKLNWSAPKDAAWLLGGNLKCVSAQDVVTLLQSSDHVAHDLCEARRACALPSPQNDASDSGDAAAYAWRNHSWVLVLRKWSNLRTSNEFRCFSVGGRLIAASQRDRYGHYEFLAPMRGELLARLANFSERHLANSAVVVSADGGCHSHVARSELSYSHPAQLCVTSIV